MRSLSLLSAALVIGTAVAKTCSKGLNITETNQSIDCDIVEGDVTIGEKVSGALSIEGPKQIKGDLIIEGVQGLVSISSSSINAIGGTFLLHDLESLNSISMTSLQTVEYLNAVKLPALDTIAFGKSGVTKASKITITDTFLSDLTGLNLKSVDSLTIITNQRMTMFNSDIVYINSTLDISENGNNFAINMTKLRSAGELQLSQVKSLYVPALEEITGAIKFEANPELETFSAPNLTDFTGSVSFLNNKKLMNVSFPLVKEIQDGDMTIVNNTKLVELTGFPKLEKILGSMRLVGDFEKVSLPKLNYVKGAVKATTTQKNDTFCNFFNDLKDNGDIAGDNDCQSEADEEGNGGKTGTGSDSDSDSGSKNDDEGAAGIVAVNMALLGLAAFAGLMQLL